MKPVPPLGWWQIGLDAWMLGVESSSVIGLRTMRMMTGAPDAPDEARRMVAEKLFAAMELGTRAMTGSLGTAPRPAARKTIAHYRRKVRANRRRLSK